MSQICYAARSPQRRAGESIQSDVTTDNRRAILRNSKRRRKDIAGALVLEARCGRPAVDLSTVIRGHHSTVAGKREVGPGAVHRVGNHLKSCGCAICRKAEASEQAQYACLQKSFLHFQLDPLTGPAGTYDFPDMQTCKYTQPLSDGGFKG